MNGPTYKQKASALLAQIIGDDGDSQLRCQFLFQAIAVYARHTMQADPAVLGAELALEAEMPGGLTAKKWIEVAGSIDRSLHKAIDAAEFRGLIESGVSEHDAIAAMKELGASPIDVIRELRAVCGHSLGRAKEIFAAHPAWADVNKAADKLHEQVLTTLGEGGEGVLQAPGVRGERHPSRVRRYRRSTRKQRASQ